MLIKMFEKAELGVNKRIVYDVDLAFFEKYRKHEATGNEIIFPPQI